MGNHDMSIMVVQGGDQQQAAIDAAAMQTEIITDAAPPMWPNTMEALLQIDRRKKLLPAPSLRLPPHPAAALETTTTTTTTTRGMGAGVSFKAENTFVDCSHFQDLLLEPSNNINKQQQHPQQQESPSSGGRHSVLRELYSDKQAESLSFMQRQLRVLNMQRLEAERELLLEDDYVSHEQQLPYNNKCTHLRNNNKAAAAAAAGAGEEEEHEPLSCRDVCSCEEEEEEEDEDTAAAAAGRGGAWNLSESRSMETADEEGRRWAHEYWRERARALAKLLSESIKREAALSAKLEGCTCVPMSPNSSKPAHLQQQQQPQQQQHPPPPPPPPPPHHHHQQQDPNNNNNSSSHQHQHLNNISSQQQQSSRVEALNYCCDSYLRFALRNAPVVVSHQDKELRYRFVYNAFPTLTEEEVIGMTDVEICNGEGISELMDFKQEVLHKGWPQKREIVFNTDMFGAKTFLVALEPVLCYSGEVMGINCLAMDVTEQADKRDRLVQLREQVAVQKTMETELNKTIHITEEAMQAKQMLATMSHEIRSPLSGVVSMAEVLATTDLDAEQRQLVDVMLTSGDLVLQLINNILDLSKIESGALKCEAKKFRPREVVKNVLQMAHASVKSKNVAVEARINDDVPLELIGDVLRIRQVFTNLVSNAIKFTHKGEVTIAVRVECPDLNLTKEKMMKDLPFCPWSESPKSRLCGSHHKPLQIQLQSNLPPSPGVRDFAVSLNELSINPTLISEEVETIWLYCDIHDTGIGIPDDALPTLFEKYTQVATSGNYGGTGLGLAICKNLVELMGGSLNVRSKENVGSTFSFKLPLQVPKDMISNDVYCMMLDKQDVKKYMVEEALTSAKKMGYMQFSTNKSRSSRETRKVMTVLTDTAGIAGAAVVLQNPTPPTPKPSSKILLAEDNKVNIMVAQSMLKRLGYSLKVVGNGADVIQALKQSTYDLILMDVCMPLMDGLEATRRIRHYERTGSWSYYPADSFEQQHHSPELIHISSSDAKLPTRIPIVALTANALPDNVEECFQHGMDSFIAKPVTFLKLEQVLKKFIPHPTIPTTKLKKRDVQVPSPPRPPPLHNPNGLQNPKS
ncbi:unnamed protein product [Sphagnum troendelagicum]|uniref:histidine kinase n=1 Tax=Sphagnum troendelagicum TaxID=128251 RepID=A0ABP0TDY9_9BRYO